MNPDELRQILEAAGRDDVPPPSAAFVDDLERRLARTHVASGRGQGRRWGAITAVAAAAAVVVAALVLQADEPPDTVLTDTSTSSTATSTTTSTTQATTTSTTSTTVVAPPTTAAVATTVAPPTTTTAPPPTTTTTVASTTTSTAPPAVEDLRLSCTTGPRPEVTCTWSASTAETFKGYLLTKRVGDGPTEEILRTTDRSLTSKTDKEVQTETRITYVVEAIDRDGNVLGRGEATVSCC